MLQSGIKIAILAQKRQNQIKCIFPQEKVFKYSLKHLKLGLYHFQFIFYSQSSKLKFSQKIKKILQNSFFFQKTGKNRKKLYILLEIPQYL